MQHKKMTIEDTIRYKELMIIEGTSAKGDIPKLNYLYDLFLFYAMHEVANLIFEYVSPTTVTNDGRPWMIDRRKESSNPYGYQNHGLVLWLSEGGRPVEITSPWGKWGFGGGGSCNEWEAILPTILARLGVTPDTINVKGTRQGYAINSIDDRIVLSPYKEIEIRAEYDDVDMAWRVLSTIMKEGVMKEEFIFKGHQITKDKKRYASPIILKENVSTAEKPGVIEMKTLMKRTGDVWDVTESNDWGVILNEEDSNERPGTLEKKYKD